MLANSDVVKEVNAMGSKELEKVLEEAGFISKKKVEALLQEKDEAIQDKDEI
jgi:hypothetical protein